MLGATFQTECEGMAIQVPLVKFMT